MKKLDEMPPWCAIELTELAQVGMPKEVCGFVLKGWDLKICKNVSNTPTRAFALDNDVLLDMLLHRMDDVVGVFHSHPSLRPGPSPDDATLMLLYPGFRHWIVTTMNVYEWRMVDDSVKPVHRDGTTAIEGLACPVLTPATDLRRQGRCPAA